MKSSRDLGAKSEENYEEEVGRRGEHGLGGSRTHLWKSCCPQETPHSVESVQMREGRVHFCFLPEPVVCSSTPEFMAQGGQLTCPSSLHCKGTLPLESVLFVFVPCAQAQHAPDTQQVLRRVCRGLRVFLGCGTFSAKTEKLGQLG